MVLILQIPDTLINFCNIIDGRETLPTQELPMLQNKHRALYRILGVTMDSYNKYKRLVKFLPIRCFFVLPDLCCSERGYLNYFQIRANEGRTLGFSYSGISSINR